MTRATDNTVIKVTFTLTMTPANRAAYANDYGIDPDEVTPTVYEDLPKVVAEALADSLNPILRDFSTRTTPTVRITAG